jgi:hypothetical protein
MKNLISCLLPLLCLPLLSFAQLPKKQSDLESDNVKGNVKQITQKYYEMEEKNGKDTIGQQFESTDRNFVINYNEKGYITSATFYRTHSTLDYRYTFKYDAAGNRIEETWFDADNALDYRLTRKFSNMGYLMEIKKYTDTTATYNEKYVYVPDPTGNPVKTSLYDENDALITMTTSIYDSYGNRIEDDNFDAKGKSLGKILYTYDNRRLKTTEEAYGADGIIMTKKKFTYEYRGKLSQQQNFDNNSKLVEKNIFAFNDQGDENEWTNFDRTGFVLYKYTYTYEYDSKGNWIKKTQLKDGKAVYVTLRDIQYAE